MYFAFPQWVQFGVILPVQSFLSILKNFIYTSYKNQN